MNLQRTHYGLTAPNGDKWGFVSMTTRLPDGTYAVLFWHTLNGVRIRDEPTRVAPTYAASQKFAEETAGNERHRRVTMLRAAFHKAGFFPPKYLYTPGSMWHIDAPEQPKRRAA
jgi:hypothetical protein